MKFRQTRRKIEKIFELEKLNLNELARKKNKEEVHRLDNPNIKNAKILNDTGWQTLNASTSIQTPVPSELIRTEGIFVGDDVDVNLDQNMLGFVEHAFLFRSSSGSEDEGGDEEEDPNITVQPFHVGQLSSYFGNRFRVYGDGQLLSAAIGPNFGQVINIHFTEDFLNEFGIPLSHTKKAFLGTITENDDTVHFGYLKEIFVNVSTIENTCESNDDTDDFLVQHLETNGQTPGNHEITSINSISFEATGITTVRTWADVQDPAPPDIPDCQLTTVITNPDTRILSFNSLNSYSIQMTQIPNFGNGFQNSVTILGSDIKSINFPQVGRHLYYDSDRDFRITWDGTNFGHLTPLPTNSGIDPEVDYSEIKVTRNELDEDISIITGNVTVSTNNASNPGVAKLSKSIEDNQQFKIWFFSEFDVVGRAIKDGTPQSFPRWDDRYTGTDFVTLTHDHDTFEKPRFTVPSKDIEWKLLVYVVNPFYYKDIKIHEVEDNV